MCGGIIFEVTCKLVMGEVIAYLDLAIAYEKNQNYKEFVLDHSYLQIALVRLKILTDFENWNEKKTNPKKKFK